MPEEGYASSSWDHTDSDVAGASSSSSYPCAHSAHTPPTTGPTSPVTSSGKHVSSPGRSSEDSAGRSSTSRWRENGPASTVERRDTITTITTTHEAPSVVEPSFDENVLRALCDLDVRNQAIFTRVCRSDSWQCSVPLLLDRIKQSMVSCKVNLPKLFQRRSSPNIYSGSCYIFQETRDDRGRIWPQHAKVGKVVFGNVRHQ